MIQLRGSVHLVSSSYLLRLLGVTQVHAGAPSEPFLGVFTSTKALVK